MSPPAIMPEKPTTAPTERSIPPEITTKVMPSARIAFIATCLDMITKFPIVKKLGDRILKTAVSMKRAMKVRN